MTAGWPKYVIGTLAAFGVASVSASLTLTGASAAPRYNSAAGYNDYNAVQNHAYDEYNMVDTNMGDFNGIELYNSLDTMGGELTDEGLKPDGPWDADQPK